MIRKGSRYESALVFRYQPGQTPVFGGLRPRVIDPAPGVVEHALTSWDRLDLLGQHYYNDVRLWWRILDANPEVLCAAELRTGQSATEEVFEADAAGRVLLIPRSPR